MLDFRTLWDNALTFDAFLAASTKHKGLWEGLYGISRIPAWAGLVRVLQWVLLLAVIAGLLWLGALFAVRYLTFTLPDTDFTSRAAPLGMVNV